MRRATPLFVFMFALTLGGFPLSAEDSGSLLDIPGFAGPGWLLSFGDESGEMLSRGPLLFRLGKEFFAGPEIAYGESSGAGPSRFLGGLRAEYFPAFLGRGPFGASLGLSLLAGAEGLGESPRVLGLAVAELDANLLILPELCLSLGPALSLEVSADGVRAIPGLGFALKEGAGGIEAPLFRSTEGGIRVGGYWQGLFTFYEGRPVFVDGGGTRLLLPSGIALGIGGGVLRSRFQGEGGELALMLTGLTLDRDFSPLPWLELSARLNAGLALYGWTHDDGSLEGGPTFMLRPEASAFLRLLPFLRVGGGLGYHLVLGRPGPGLEGSKLSSLALTIQARVGR